MNRDIPNPNPPDSSGEKGSNVPRDADTNSGSPGRRDADTNSGSPGRKTADSPIFGPKPPDKKMDGTEKDGSNVPRRDDTKPKPGGIGHGH